MDLLVRFLADGALLIILAVGVGLLFRAVTPPKWLQVFPLVIMAGLTSLLIAKLMSLIYQPQIARPFLEQGVAPRAAYIDNPGFPSDHALLAGVIVLAVYFVTPYKKTAIVLCIIALLMGAARVMALVHTPVDVIGGFAAAAIGAMWYINKKR